MKKLLMIIAVVALLAALLVAVMPVSAASDAQGQGNEDPPQAGGSPGQTEHDGPPGWSTVPGQWDNGP